MRSLKVLKLKTSGKLPTKHHGIDAGYDLYAAEDMFIPLGSTSIVSTGIAIQIPMGYMGKVMDRSSMGAKGLIVAAGVIDSLYSGEVSVILHNFSAAGEYEDGYDIKAGDKIAQIVVIPIESWPVKETKKVWKSKRGSKALGSSGR